MVSVLDAGGLALLVEAYRSFLGLLEPGEVLAVTRWLRVRLSSRWGPVLYAVTLGPVLLFVSTLVLSGVLGIGPDLGDPGLVLFVVIVFPLGVGLAIDYLWMPPPGEADVPAPRSGG